MPPKPKFTREEVVAAELVRSIAGEFMSGGLLALLATAAVCLLTSMNDMAAPAVSLEGQSLWLTQSLPVSPRQVLLIQSPLP